MLRSAFFLAGAVFTLCACYELPGVDSSQVIAVSVTPTTAQADGVSMISVGLSLDARSTGDSTVTIRTEAGVLDFSASGEAARSITLKVPRSRFDDEEARKSVEVPMRVPRTPGAVLVRATVEDVTVATTLLLEPTLPTSMFSESNVAALRADGASRAEIGVFLFADPPANVSLGTQVVSRVCCVDADSGHPTACTAPPPLRVTPATELTAGNDVTVTAVSESLSGDSEVKLWVVSAISTAAMADLPCRETNGVHSSAAQLTLRPGSGD